MAEYRFLVARTGEEIIDFENLPARGSAAGVGTRRSRHAKYGDALMSFDIVILGLPVRSPGERLRHFLSQPDQRIVRSPVSRPFPRGGSAVVADEP